MISRVLIETFNRREESNSITHQHERTDAYELLDLHIWKCFKVLEMSLAGEEGDKRISNP